MVTTPPTLSRLAVGCSDLLAQYYCNSPTTKINSNTRHIPSNHRIQSAIPDIYREEQSMLLLTAKYDPKTPKYVPIKCEETYTQCPFMTNPHINIPPCATDKNQTVHIEKRIRPTCKAGECLYLRPTKNNNTPITAMMDVIVSHTTGSDKALRIS